MDNSDFRNRFIAHKVEIPDGGFSQDVKRRLPVRRSILPQMVMMLFIMAGLALMFAIHDISLILEQVKSLVTSLSQLQMPSLSSIVIYLCIPAMAGIIYFSMANVDAS